MKDVLKNWRTSFVGLAIMAYAGYQVYTVGTVDIKEIMVGLIGVGFLVGKDGPVSHTKP